MSKLPYNGVDYAELSHLIPIGMLRLDLVSYLSSKDKKVNTFNKAFVGASLVAQWLRICLPMQETRVRALVWEDPTCHGANGPVSHSY